MSEAAYGMGAANRTSFPKKDIAVDQRQPVAIQPLDSAPLHRLGVWPATAICGNDIMSSCLYVAALSAVYAGKYAPLCLLLVAGVLYLYRWIYAEVGDALPLNGGAYNCLLNTTSKFRASMAACMTILSYMATAVISATEAVHYGGNLWPGLPVVRATVILLAAFALLSIVGITESAVVAVAIFVFHIFTLVCFCFVGVFFILRQPSMLIANWQTPSPHHFVVALFFGFAAALLGISGFESSSNFIEEQAEGVFPKTLRNMWIGVSIFNPLIALLVLGVLPIAAMQQHGEDLLAFSGARMAGTWFGRVVSVDAAIVLSGALLTAYVGTTGLVKRLALDRCLPQALLKENGWRHTSHRIIIAFFLLCASILWITHGHVQTLAGVYTISFLGVMALFAIGNMLLKVKRSELPRRYRAGWVTVLVALAATIVGLIGNVALNPRFLWVFLAYFLPAAGLVTIMLWRISLLKVVLFTLRATFNTMRAYNRRFTRAIIRRIGKINSLGIVFFTSGDSRKSLNDAMLYVRNNEQTKRLRVVHVYKSENDIPPQLSHDLAFLDEVYPEIKIEFITVQGVFGPEMIERLSRDWGIPKNYMFIGSPSGRRFPHRISELGGVRLII
jgi:amino acid transporter